MNLLEQFIIFLLNQKPKRSLVTVKNYKADIKQFIAWYETKYSLSFDPIKITPLVFDEYKSASSLSRNSLGRHTSSLRKFFGFLKKNKIIFQNPLEKEIVSAEDLAKADPWMLRNFKNFLYEDKKSHLTIKNYINDIRHFFAWLEQVALVKYSFRIEDKNLLNKISFTIVDEYKQRLIEAKYSPLTVNRKLSSLRNYITWAKSQGLIAIDSSQNVIPVETPEMFTSSKATLSSMSQESSFPPIRLAEKSARGISLIVDTLLIIPIVKGLQNAQYLLWKATGKKIFKKHIFLKSSETGPDKVSNIKKEFYAPLDISTQYLPLHKRLWHYIRFARPKWYKIYHSYPFTHYFHFAILTILSCAIGLGIYNTIFFTETQNENNVLGNFATPAPRILSFQGQLTDSSETPITQEAKVLFSLYDDQSASSEAALWQENDTIQPDSSGNFSIYLGKKTSIPDAIFSQNSRLFLGITVGNSPELQPRQEIATASLASNAQALQGFDLINNTTKTNNVILALDSSGNLSIAGEKAHTFQVIGGDFVLSGKVLSIATTPGSNGNVQIVPDGMGKIDLTRPIQNSTNNNNLTSALGSVEFDDTVSILATSSAQSAFYINQNSTGPLISANTNETAKFILENDGSGMFAGNLAVNGSGLTSSSSTFNLLNWSTTTLNIGGQATAINLGILGGNTTIKSNLILSSLSSNGGILYTNGSGQIFQTKSSSDSDCLTGGSNPSFTPCSKILNQADTVGIGTSMPMFKLDVQDLQDATAAAQIYNTSTDPNASGLIVKLGNLSASISATNHFINFETDGIGIVGSVQGEGAGVSYRTSGIADFAEYLKKNQNQTIPFGSVVCLDNAGLTVACDDNNNKIIGVASEHPAFLGGKNLGNGSIAVGLTGQIETLVADQNGKIKAGDVLTASNIPGVATKTTKAGQIIGKALEDSTTDESKVIGYYDPDNMEYRDKTNFPNIPLKSTIVRIFKIPVLVDVSWYDPGAYLASNGQLIIQKTNSNNFYISSSIDDALTNVGGFFEVMAANIKAGLINASDIVTNTLIVTSDSLVVNGQNLRDYIVSVVNNPGITESKTIPTINTNKLSADIISPLSSPDLIVKLATPSGSLMVENASGSAVVKIDDQGNASFSGTLNSLSLQTSNASISGTLHAGNIIADSIAGLDARISNIYSTNFVNLASYSAQLSYLPDLSADRAQFNQGLMVFGPTSLSDLALAGKLSIGSSMFITENSIETLGTDLSLQSLKQGGLSIMGGLVYVDTEGNLKVQGDLSVSGKLAVNIISPLPTSDLIIDNASGSGILSVNQAGDLVSSGSGTFTKLNFNFIQPVLAVSATEIIASSSAGIANINPYQSEITIDDSLVTKKSIIYITPVGTPSAQAPFLMRQTPQESFTVGVQSPTNKPIEFNWLIVN